MYMHVKIYIDMLIMPALTPKKVKLDPFRAMWSSQSQATFGLRQGAPWLHDYQREGLMFWI